MEEISGLVFKRSERTKEGEFTLDAQALSTLLALDGRTPLGEVARRLNLDMNTIHKVMLQLARLKLVVRVEKPQNLLPSTLVAVIKSELAKSVGPIGDALLEDVLGELKLDVKRIPMSRMPEIIEALAGEIPDAQRRQAFIKVMLSKLR